MAGGLVLIKAENMEGEEIPLRDSFFLQILTFSVQRMGIEDGKLHCILNITFEFLAPNFICVFLPIYLKLHNQEEYVLFLEEGT